MKRLLPLLFCAALAGGCARSDLGERAASAVVKTALEGEAKDAKSSLQKAGDGEMIGGKLTGTDANGKKRWQVSAERIAIKGQVANGNPQRATLTRATVKLYKEGALESTFEAPLIEFFNTETGLRLAMLQGVSASNAGALGKDGVPIAISAPRGDVDVNKRLVNLSGGATIKRGEILVKGETLRTETDLARSRMIGDVVAVSPQGTTKARDAVFAWKANELTANGVTFVKDDLTLTGAKLSADTASEKGTLSGDVRAVTPDTKASAPSVDFDWKADLIRIASARLEREGASLQAARLQTDSQLKVGSATDVVMRKDDAVLRAASAQGFDGLTRLSGTKVTVVRDGTTLVAARARARNWSQNSGVVEGSGGVTATNADGRLEAPTATWSGGESGQVTASGGVEIVSDGTTIRGAKAVSDAKFAVATLSGNVRANLADGSTLSAPQVRKSGAQVAATGGATARMKSQSNLGAFTIAAPRIDTTIGGDSARASGGVTMKSASGATASAPSATYNLKAQTVVASGGVTYRDPKGATLKGEKLTANLKLESARMTNVRAQASSEVFEGGRLFD